MIYSDSSFFSDNEDYVSNDKENVPKNLRKALKIWAVRSDELPMCAQTLLGSKYIKKYKIEKLNSAVKPDEGSFVYIGIKEQLVKQINPIFHSDNKIKIQINVDGVRLYKSSSVTKNQSLLVQLLNEKLDNIMDYQNKNFSQIKAEVRCLSNKMNEIENYILANRSLDDKANIMNFYNFSEKYNFSQKFPIETIDVIKKFDEELKNNKDLNNDLQLHFTQTLNIWESTLSNTITPVFKNFYSKDVLSNFTASKAANDKHIFKETNFYTILAEAIFFCFDKEKDILIEKLNKNVPSIKTLQRFRRKTK